MEKQQQQGIAFKKIGGKPQVHIQPETVTSYIESLPRNERNWIVFDFIPQANGRVFAKIKPENK